MNWNRSLIRRVIYLVAIAVLVIPLSIIGRPAPTGGESGGVLADLRYEGRFARAQLGEIDPVSDAMNLSLFGFRGIAANVLWTQANYYQKIHDYDQLNATVKQLVKLQPHFISVWKFQAWNLAYNVSVEYDDYRRRYEWVKKGVLFLLEGVQKNENDHRLTDEMARFFSQKLGRSDEKKQFRREFKRDTVFHNQLPIDKDECRDHRDRIDNWLVARWWHKRSERIVSQEGGTLHTKNQLLFYSQAPFDLMYYCIALENDGVFGDVAAEAWRRAGTDWQAYGWRSVPTTFGRYIRLNELDRAGSSGQSIEMRLVRIRKEFYDLSAGVREKLQQQKRAALSDEERKAVGTPAAERTEAQRKLASEAESKLQVTHDEVADAVPAEVRAQAQDLARRLANLEQLATIIRRYRGHVNFAHWRTRAQVEQSPEALDARRYLFEAEEKYRRADIDLRQIRRDYEKAWAAWHDIFQQHPELIEEPMAEDLFDPLDRYRDLVINQLSEPFPQDFPLQPLLKKHRDWEDRWEPLFADDGASVDPSPGESTGPDPDLPNPPMPQEDATGPEIPHPPSPDE